MLRLGGVIAALLFVATSFPTAAMDFQLLQTGKGQRVVLAAGPIEAGDAQRLAAALTLATRDRSGTKELLLNSPGGLVGEALVMTEIMDQTGVHTVVPAGAVCGSACASVLFVSGKYRTIDKGGMLLIHSCYDARDGRAMTDCNAAISVHAQAEGASGPAMMALQQVAGSHNAFGLGPAEAACFGFTRAPGARALKGDPPCIRELKAAVNRRGG